MIKSNKIFFSYVATVTLITVGLIAGCSSPEAQAIEDVERAVFATQTAERVLAKAKYVKDPRTGFCFAYVTDGPHGIAMTMVPCSAEVEQLIKTNPK